MKSGLFEKRRRFDIILFLLVISLVVIGLLFIYSASKYNASKNYNDAYYYVKKQLIGAIIGLGAMIFFYFINLEKIKKWRFWVLLLSVVLLCLVFIPSIGKNSYGANRWINLGFFTIQASEIAKFGFVFYAASVLSEQNRDPKKFKSILPVLISGGLICLLIILEPNMSITMCVGLTMLVMLLVGGCSLKNFLLILVPALCLVPVLIIIEPYRLQRLSAYIDPWSSPLEEGFQLIQSFYSLGAGGLFGLGYGNSRQKYLFLPFSESDFIFSIIGEEMGLFGCVLIMALFLLIIFRGFKIALKSDTRFKCYLASGLTALIAIQFLLNIAVVTGTIPPTGLPLPFVSFGSSSLIVFMGAIGMLLNIGSQCKATKFKGKLP